MSFLHMLEAEWLKTKHGALRKLILIAPLTYVLFMMWYCGCFSNHIKSIYEIHEIFYQVGCIALPLLIALIGALLCAVEEPAGNFGGYLMSPFSRGRIYLSKLIALLLIVVLLVGGSALLMGGVLVLYGETVTELWLFLQGGLLAALGALPVTLLQVNLSLSFGTGASIGVGGAGLLISAIMGTTTIGDAIWQYIPWAWSARLSMLPVLKYTKFANLNPSVLFAKQLERGLIPLTVTLVVGLLVSLLWFKNFAGHKNL